LVRVAGFPIADNFFHVSLEIFVHEDILASFFGEGFGEFNRFRNWRPAALGTGH
jgi:hypothetical protein